MLNPESTHHRTLMLLIAAASSYMIFATTEKCFYEADVRNATRLVQTLRVSKGGLSVPQRLAQIHPDVPPATFAWGGVLTDNHYGFVRVTAEVPDQAGIVTYVFDVNLSGAKVHPHNGHAKDVLNYLRQQKKDATADKPSTRSVK